jgi:hypothetical protein
MGKPLTIMPAKIEIFNRDISHITTDSSIEDEFALFL